jgi:predicted ArsR family transcriptional regulator
MTTARALAQPSRRRIVEELSASPEGLTAFSLAERVGIHHNAVRQHLSILAAAGIVAAEREAPQGRGRPSTRYRVVDGDAQAAAGHRELVRLLVKLLRQTGFAPQDLESFGRSQGRGMTEAGAGPRAVLDAFARLGFAPHETASAAEAAEGRIVARLECCPFREAVLAPGGESVCHLHRGLAEGLLERAAPGARLAGFEVRDPIHAGCRLVIESATGAEP